MSKDILQYLNKIKISVSEKDQMVWESQAASKSYKEVTEKLGEECDQLNIEITQIDEEISKIETQIKILESNFQLQVDSLPLNQQSLINQRLYKKHLTEKVRQYQEETDRIIDEYSRYIEDCKEKFKLTNPTYKILQAKRTELKQNKIRCMDLEQKIIELKDVNKQKMEIKQKLFYSDIVEFIQNWMNRRKHLETMELLREATMKEREYMLKLTEATEMLKRKQADRFLRNQTGSFNIPHIEFFENDSASKKREDPVKAKAKSNNSATDLQSILVELQTDISHHSKSAGNHELKFNTLNSKVRILEKKTIRAYEAEKPHVSKSKKERSAEIEAKIQKVVQNFNKSISRHNSRKSISSSQKISKADKKAKEKPDQRSDVCREDGSVEVSQNSQKGPSETSGATQAIQNLNLTSQATERPGGDFFKEFTLQFPEKQLSRFSKENDIFKADPVQKHPNETYGNNKFSQNPQGFSSTSKAIEPAENITSNRDKSSPFHGDLSNKLRDDVPKEKSTFEISASGFAPIFGTMGHRATFFGSSDATTTNNSTQCTNTEVPAFLMDVSDDYAYKSPEFTPNYISPPTGENNANGGTNLFSFGQSSNIFSFK